MSSTNRGALYVEVYRREVTCAKSYAMPCYAVSCLFVVSPLFPPLVCLLACLIISPTTPLTNMGGGGGASHAMSIPIRALAVPPTFLQVIA